MEYVHKIYTIEHVRNHLLWHCSIKFKKKMSKIIMELEILLQIHIT